jgi:hypothetical protein
VGPIVCAVLLAACRSERAATPPGPAPSPTAVSLLEAPSAARPHDLDLHLHWRAAAVRQTLPELDLPSAFRQHPEFVSLDGEAHRSLLLLPSLDGVPSLASFRVRLSERDACELVTWIALDPLAHDPSDGVDFAVGVGEGEPTAEALHFERLPGAKSRAWRQIRVDLAPWRGRTVWITLAARERGNRAGDRLLWGDPRVRLVVDSSAPVDVDLGADDAAARRITAVPWSEVNVFKAYYLFKEDDAASKYPRSISLQLPWARSLRLFSSLGANWGPSLERDYEQQMGHNPSADSRREQSWARQYEFFRDGPEWASSPIAARFDWGAYDGLLDRAATTGMGLHIHMSGAPELFTGGRGWYPSYHFNELPVVDEAGFKAYIDAVFAHLASRPWFPTAHFSFFSEPNAMWTEYDGATRHFGYQGDAEQYARQYVWTWQAMRPYVAPGQIHLGPWVVEPDPGDRVSDNLPTFLRTLRAEFEHQRETLPPWSAFAFNVYETAQLALDGMVEHKIAYVRRLVADVFPGVDLPLRIDEIGIHPLLLNAFEHDAGVPLASTRWAAAWQAEMLALLVDQHIQQAGPWWIAPTARAYLAYVAASHVLGAVDLDVSAAHVAKPHAVDGATRPVVVHLAAESAARVGVLASRNTDGGVRAALWQLPRFATTDARLADAAPTRRVRLRLPVSPHGWRVTIVAASDVRLPAGEPAERLRLEWTPDVELDRVQLAADDHVDLDVDPASLYLIDASPVAGAP